jgi:hypothetical protein
MGQDLAGVGHDRYQQMRASSVALQRRDVEALAWGLVAAGLFAAVGVLAAVAVGAPHTSPLGTLSLLVFGVPYGWLGWGAFRLARGGPGNVSVDGNRVVITHPGLFDGAIRIDRSDLAVIAVDSRSPTDRTTAAKVRRGGVVPPDFIDPAIPVISSAPSAHARWGSAVVPNCVLFLAHPLTFPSAGRAIRVLLAISGGRGGHYRGPHPEHPYDAVRLCVTDVTMLGNVAEQWGVLGDRPRDRRYLSPVSASTRARARHDRMIGWAVVGSTLALFGLMAVIGR